AAEFLTLPIQQPMPTLTLQCCQHQLRRRPLAGTFLRIQCQALAPRGAYGGPPCLDQKPAILRYTCGPSFCSAPKHSFPPHHPFTGAEGWWGGKECYCCSLTFPGTPAPAC